LIASRIGPPSSLLYGKEQATGSQSERAANFTGRVSLPPIPELHTAEGTVVERGTENQKHTPQGVQGHWVNPVFL